jgi:hypothetical protein
MAIKKKVSTQQHARVFTGEIRQGQIEEALKTFNREVLPAVRKIRGFKGHQLLIKGRRFLWLTRWNECPGPAVINFRSRPIAPFLLGRLQHIRYSVGPVRKAAPQKRPVRKTPKRPGR